MIKLLEDYLSDWKTKAQILNFLDSDECSMRTRISERLWRKYVEEHNERFYNHEEFYFIAHSSKGYKITTEKEDMLASFDDYFSRGIDQIKKARAGYKALGENMNYNFMEEIMKELEV